MHSIFTRRTCWVELDPCAMLSSHVPLAPDLVTLQQGHPEKREVRQFQFTAWPDHGVPDHPTPLLLFMRRVKAMTPPDSGPMIVHCR